MPLGMWFYQEHTLPYKIRNVNQKKVTWFVAEPGKPQPDYNGRQNLKYLAWFPTTNGRDPVQYLSLGQVESWVNIG
jgi:endo-alpha-1,4-polygalactosaminidase (GH114 family)